MKKIISIFAIFAASAAIADEYSQMLEIAKYQADLQLQIEQAKTPNKTFAQRYQCYPNTFIWYLWQDYDKGDSFQKIEALKKINSLTKEINK